MATQRRRSTKGTRSKTHPGRKNYTTKKGDKVFHRKGKNVRKSRKPYSKKKRGGQWYHVSETEQGKDDSTNPKHFRLTQARERDTMGP